MPDIEKLANIFGAETIKQIYQDGLSGAVKETGEVLTDFVRALRLFTAPVQLLASYQKRLSKYLNAVTDSVPEENQIPAPAYISGPIMERLKYMEDENHLTELYLNLLRRAIDKERINEAHPAFLHLIDQLAPDEAYFLFRLREKEINISTHRDYDAEKNYFNNYQITKTELPATEFVFPENFHMYYSHLESLNLVSWPVIDTEYPRNEQDVQTGLIKHSKIILTDFGKLFVKACIPEKGFIIIK